MPDESFKDFVLDQLSALPDVRARAMFGAFGIYCGETFFGIVDEGRLFFKTGADNQSYYLERDMPAFTYTAKGKTMTMAYHEVPPDVLEQPHEFICWARKAIAVAGMKKKRSK